MEAVGAYLMELRTQKGITREQIADATGVTVMTIFRIEERDQEPKAGIFAGIVKHVGASWDEVQRLLLDPRATGADGKAAARRWLLTRSEEYGEAVADLVYTHGAPDDIQGLTALLERALDRMRSGEHAIAALARAVREQSAGATCDTETRGRDEAKERRGTG
jgi:transcriptional regulator with XRE-family HTH domain